MQWLAILLTICLFTIGLVIPGMYLTAMKLAGVTVVFGLLGWGLFSLSFFKKLINEDWLQTSMPYLIWATLVAACIVATSSFFSTALLLLCYRIIIYSYCVLAICYLFQQQYHQRTNLALGMSFIGQCIMGGIFAALYPLEYVEYNFDLLRLFTKYGSEFAMWFASLFTT